MPTANSRLLFEFPVYTLKGNSPIEFLPQTGQHRIEKRELKKTFIIQKNQNIFPIEVKAEENLKAKISLCEQVEALLNTDDYSSTFTDKVIEILSNEKEHLVFLLWGAFAQKKAKFIDASKHLILTSGHPSPMSANQGKWFGNKHFSKTNEYLKRNGKSQIDW